MNRPTPDAVTILRAMRHVLDHPWEWTPQLWEVEMEFGTARNFLGWCFYFGCSDVPPVVDNHSAARALGRACREFGLTSDEVDRFVSAKGEDNLWAEITKPIGRWAEFGNTLDDLPEDARAVLDGTNG